MESRPEKRRDSFKKRPADCSEAQRAGARSLSGLRHHPERPDSSKQGASALIGVRGVWQGGGGRYISYHVWAAQLVWRRWPRLRPLLWKSTGAPRYPPPCPAPGPARAPPGPPGKTPPFWPGSRRLLPPRHGFGLRGAGWE